VLDPSDPEVIGKLIAETLLEQQRYPLANIPKFHGSGVYAIYYTGDFDAYLPVSKSETPMYVGKADPASHGAVTPVEQGTRLWGRLNDHRRNIGHANNLQLADFECRYLVVKSAWQITAEKYLINGFMPIWNDESRICFGFGKHGDDPGTRSNTRSPWDTLHPGRTWAWKDGNTPNPLTPEQIKANIGEHFNLYMPARAPELPKEIVTPLTEPADYETP
jgi:hypothetical protein